MIKVRDTFDRIQAEASDIGIDALDWTGLTPREIEIKLRSETARRREELKKIDLLAWFIGQYVAIGVNAPKKYPTRPNRIKLARIIMSDDAMKQTMVKLAARRKKYDP